MPEDSTGGWVRRRAALVVLLVLGCLASGCRVALDTVVAVDPDGSGTLTLVADFDAAAVAQMDEARFDPTTEVAAVADGDAAWTVTRTATDGGGLVVELTRELEDANAAGDVLAELTAGLTDNDPAVVVDLDLEATEEGTITADGTALLRAPGTTVATQDGEPIGPSPAELAALVADHLDAAFVLQAPGQVRAADADVVETSDGDRVLRWHLAVDEPRSLHAAIDPPRWFEQPVVLTAILAGLLLVLVVVAWLVIRRRRRRRWRVRRRRGLFHRSRYG